MICLSVCLSLSLSLSLSVFCILTCIFIVFLQDSEKYVEELLSLFNRFSKLVEEAFHNDPRFLTARDKVSIDMLKIYTVLCFFWGFFFCFFCRLINRLLTTLLYSN